jgi:hypothetical protein
VTKFHTHTKQAKLIVLYVFIFIFYSQMEEIDSASKTEILEVEVIHSVRVGGVVVMSDKLF